jgi:hypothetical protein
VKNWKTTLVGILIGLGSMLLEQLQGGLTLRGALMGTGIAALGIVAKDFNVTGRTVKCLLPVLLALSFCQPVKAQVIELPCPSGTGAINQTRNANTNGLKQYICRDRAGNVTFQGSIVGPGSSVATFNVKNSPYLAQGNGTTNDTAAIQAAITDAQAAGGIVFFPQGNYKYSTLTFTGQNLLVQGAGVNATTLTSTANGTDAIVVNAAVIPPYLGLEFANLTLAGNANAATVGLDFYGTSGVTLRDVAIRDFAGAGAVGWKMRDIDATHFCERIYVYGLSLFNNTTDVEYLGAPGITSFGYHEFHGVHLSLYDGQTGFYIGANTFLYNSTWDVRGNISDPTTGATAISLNSGASANLSGSILMEETSGALATGIYGDNTSNTFNFAGNLDFLAFNVQKNVGATDRILLGGPNTITGSYEWSVLNPSGFLQRTSKLDLFHPYSGGQQDITIWLANYGGVPTENNGIFRILTRATDDTNQNVDETGTGTPPGNIFYTDSNQHVGIGPGWDSANPPIFGLDLSPSGNPSAPANFRIGGGIADDGSGFKLFEVGSPLGGTCPTAAAIGASCTSANINWVTPFADNFYILTCTLNNVTAQPHIVQTTQLAAGAGFTITIAADTAVAANAGAHCIAVHSNH